MFTKSSRLGLFHKPPALNSVPLFRETRTPFATPLGAEPLAGARGGWLVLAWETATGRGLSSRADHAPCASLCSLPKAAPAAPRTPARASVPALLPGMKKAPGKNPGAVIADGGAAGVSLLQLQKSPEGPPSRGAVTPDAAPMAEWGRRPSGAIVSLGVGKQEQGMGYGTWNTGGCVVVTPPCERTSNLSGETSI